MAATLPRATLEVGVESYAPYQEGSGELRDPVVGVPTQYATACHALSRAVLATLTDGDDAARHLDAAERGLRASLRHVLAVDEPANVAHVSRDLGEVRAVNHRDFFWPMILRTLIVLREAGVDVSEHASAVGKVDILRAFRSRPPDNWAAVWLLGEWLRVREGLSPFTVEDVDGWLRTFLTTRIRRDLGLYLEPGLPNSYDLFTRYHLLALLTEGYGGPWRDDLEELLETGLRRSLAVQLSDGSLASAHRSTGQTWTLGAQCVYFTEAANRLGDPALVASARAAAWRALDGLRRWQRPGDVFSPVENLLPAAWRVGYEPYTADAHYGSLALAFLALAVRAGLDGDRPVPRETARSEVLAEHDPTFRAVLHHGPYSVAVNAHPAPDYDGGGITDVTFGAGRYLHLASSVRHLGTGRLFNLGLACRRSPGRGVLEVVAQEEGLTLTGPMVSGPGARLVVEARPRGRPWTYRIEVAADDDGLAVSEATPGRDGWKTLLVPYLRDAGLGTRTEVEVDGAQVRLRLRGEEVRIHVDAPIDDVLDVPHGFENRRGLCGLLRLDLAGEREGVAYRIDIVD